jgi:hypothetical protein
MAALIPIPVRTKLQEKSAHQMLVISSHSSLPSKKISEIIKEGIGGAAKGMISGKIADSKTIGDSVHHEISYHGPSTHELTIS